MSRLCLDMGEALSIAVRQGSRRVGCSFSPVDGKTDASSLTLILLTREMHNELQTQADLNPVYLLQPLLALLQTEKATPSAEQHSALCLAKH